MAVDKNSTAGNNGLYFVAGSVGTISTSDGAVNIKDGRVMYVQVPSATALGSITIFGSSDTSDRKVNLNSGKQISMLKAGSSQNFVAGDIENVNNGWYIKVASVSDFKFNKIEVTLTSGSYTDEPTPTTYKVTYEGNGHTSGAVPTDQTNYPSGEQVTVLGNTGNLAKTGYTFSGWNTQSGGTGTSYKAGDKFNITANTTLWAQWQEVQPEPEPATIADWDYTYSNQPNGKKGFTAAPTVPVVKDDKLKFQPNVRYSNWVIQSRINSFGESSKTNGSHGFGIFTDEGAQTTAGANAKGVIHYVPGFVAEGILEAIDYYRSATDLGINVKPWYYAVQNWANKYDMSKGTKEGQELDGMSSVKIYSLLKKFAVNKTFPDGVVDKNATTVTTANTRFSTALKALKTYNSTYSIKQEDSQLAAGGWYHKSTYAYQMWCDGQYMGPATLAHIINDGKDYTKVASTGTDWDLINKQINISWNYLWNDTEKLLYHGFSVKPGTTGNKWATVTSPYDGNAKTNPAFWSRADGWYVLALVDILQQMDRTAEKGGANYNNIKAKLQSLIAGIVDRQNENGTWNQLLLKNTSSFENWAESSASAIFLTAIMRAQRLGYLSTDYTAQIKKGYKGFVENFLVSDGNGGINVIDCSQTATLKDGQGDEDYYLNTANDTKPATDFSEGKALGAFIMAAVEYERLYLEHNTGDATQLYSYTVAPNYIASTTVNAIGGKFTAMGLNAQGNPAVVNCAIDSREIKMELSKAIAAGDVIHVTMYQDHTSNPGENQYVASISDDFEGQELARLAIPTSAGSHMCTVDYEVQEGNGLIGKQTLWLGRANEGCDIFVHKIEIIRSSHQGKDTSIKKIVINNHIIPATMVSDDEGNHPEYDYRVGSLWDDEGWWEDRNPVYNETIFVPVHVYTNDPNATVTAWCKECNVKIDGIVKDKNGAWVVRAIKDPGNKGTEARPSESEGAYNPKGNHTMFVYVESEDKSVKTKHYVKVFEAKDQGSATSNIYKVEDMTYYEGQKMQTEGVDAFISLTAGSNEQLAFPAAKEQKGVAAADGKYEYAITNTNGSNINTEALVPTEGHFYKFVPKKAGMLKIAMQLKNHKKLVITNGRSDFFTVGGNFTADFKSRADGTTPVAMDLENMVDQDAVGTVTFYVSPAAQGEKEKAYYVYSLGSKLSLMGFEFTEDVPSFNVKVTANGNGSVSIKDGNGNTIESGSDVVAGTKVIITATPESDQYKFGGFTYEGTVVSFANPYVINVLNNIVDMQANFAAKGLVSGTAMFPIDVMKEFGNYKSGDVNTLYDTKNQTTANITVSTTSDQVQPQRDQTGTKVRSGGSFTITPSEGRKIKSVTIVTDKSNRNLTSNPATTAKNEGTTWTYKFNSLTTPITFKNNDSQNIYVLGINVVYEIEGTGDKRQVQATLPHGAKIEDYVGSTHKVPAVTVTLDGQVLSADKYSISYESANTAIANVDGSGNVALIGTGSTAIYIKVTPNIPDESDVEGVSVRLNVESKPLEKIIVTVPDLHVYSNAETYSMPVVEAKIHLTPEHFLEPGEYNISYEKISGDDIVNISGSSISLKGSSRNWTVGTATIKVTITPTQATQTNYRTEDKATEQFTIYVHNTAGKIVPTITMLDKLTFKTGTTGKPITAFVTHEGQNISDFFTFSYSLSGVGKISSSTTNSLTFTPGSNEGTATLTINAKPKDAYVSQYDDPTEKVVKITVSKDVKQFTTVEIDPTTYNAEAGNTVPKPTLTVADADGSLDEQEYTSTWSTSAPAIVSCSSSGAMKAVSTGTATIYVVVSKDGYETAFAAFTVKVTDRGEYRVNTEHDGEYTRGFTMTTEDGNLAMTLGGWIFPNSIASDKYPEVSGDELGGTNNWPSNATKSNYSPDGYNLWIGYGSNTNPRNEFKNNAQPENVNIYNATINKVESMSCIDPMFNVPTSGSYLTFTPKVNGTITATIYQNGAFDVASKKPQYRPQRRVFVIDEQGTLIPSTPKLLKTDEKFDKDFPSFTSYTWDMDNNSNVTQKMMLDHFGIENFSSEDTKFVNGVYECLADNDKMNNQAWTNGKRFPGARGWVVLRPAPVSYTFNVEAGKTYYLYNFASRIGFYGMKFAAEKSMQVDEISYSERSDNAVAATAAGHVAQVSLDRKFKVGTWNSCVLPFSLNKQQVDAIFGHTYDKDHQKGTEILYFERVVGNTIYYTRHAYNTIVAGKPFLIRPTGKKGDGSAVETLVDEQSIELNTAKVTAFPYVTIENVKPASWGREDSEGYHWTSDYQVQTINPGDYYINSAGELIMRQVSAAKVQSFRGFLQQKAGASQAKALQVAYYDLLKDDSDIPSSIPDLMVDEQGRLVNVPADGRVYNLNGQLVSADASSVHSLPKGIYVVNGKKIVVE